MTLAILATGDELIHGDTLNTNAHYIAHELCALGFSMGAQLVCGDKEKEIIAALSFLSAEHDIIILIGGLGPTSDDRTRFALAKFLKLTMVEHEAAIKHIVTRLKGAKLSMNDGNRQQALFPESAKLLANPYGTAMGCYFKHQNQQYILLPGPPKECLPMFRNELLPQIKSASHSRKQMIKWRLFAVAESQISQKLDEALKDIRCQTGYRLEMPYLEFKVRCEPEDIPAVKNIVEPIVRPHIISSANESASVQLKNFLSTYEGPPLVVCDEATGGALQAKIFAPETCTKIHFDAHASKNNLVPVDNCSKDLTTPTPLGLSAQSIDPADKPRGVGCEVSCQQILAFHCKGLENYWLEKENASNDLTLEYHYCDAQGTEKHTVTVRNQLYVRAYAVEWLSFRLFEIIEQLHERKS